MIFSAMRPPVDAQARPGLAWLLSLPAVATPKAPRSAETGGFQGGRTRPVRVLLVEDDVAIAEMYSMQLRLDGYVVEHARHADDALGRIAQAPPELVLLDLLLPGRGGLEVLAEVKERWGGPPVVILSNYGDPQLISRARGMGARDYVVKSRTTPREVSRSVARWLDAPD